MSSYTRFGALTWEWDRLTALDFATRAFWVFLYTSDHAKKSVPGLFRASVSAIAADARIGIDEATKYLESLIDHDLVEYDPKHRVLRLTALPDAGDWPSNPAILMSWWKRFHDIPACGVRDAHVPTLRWMIEAGAREAAKNASGKPSAKHEEVWGQTFGTVQIPVARRRGVRSLAEYNNDTSTDFQPGLFAPLKASGDPLRTPPDPQVFTGDARSVENSDLNKISTPETLSRGSGEGEGEGEGASSDLRSSSSGGIGGLSTGRPKLVLVPGPGPFTVDEIHACFAGAPYWPRILTEEAQLALGHAIGALADLAREHDVFALLRGRIERRMGEISRAGPMWLAAPGRLTALVQEAIAHQRDSEAKSAALREVLGNGLAP